MRILLIQPALDPDRKYGHKMMQIMFRPAPVTLPTIAACTPIEHEVKIIDDAFMKIPFDADVDLVGITGSTPFSTRMKEISDKFRSQGVPVVVGGVFPTLCPEESCRFADAVVIGDAEDTWPLLLNDCKNGKLKPTYHSSRPPLTGRPFPRRNLLKSSKYILPSGFQFSRGCVHSCGFCSLRIQYGFKVRLTPIDAVVEDIRSCKKALFRPLIFWDDNLLNDKQYAMDLFTAIKPLKVKWVGQSTINIADHPEVLGLAAESGCQGLFVGIESFSQNSLIETNKKFNHVEDYREKVKRIHSFGIMVQAGIVFGFDHDGKDIFERTVEAAERIKLDTAAFSILTPYPGTDLYNQLESERRIITHDLSKYDSDNVVFKPNRMSPEELLEGWKWAQHQFYSPKCAFKRIFGTRPGIIKYFTNAQYIWFTRLRFSKGHNPSKVNTDENITHTTHSRELQDS